MVIHITFNGCDVSNNSDLTGEWLIPKDVVVVGGPREGTVLESTKSFISYWFAWAIFYPNAVIYQ